MKFLTFNFLCYCLTNSLLEIYAEAVDLNQVVFVILSQSNHLHQKISEETKTILKDDLSRAGVANQTVLDLNHELAVEGGWSIFPLLPILHKYTEESKWFVFLAENSRVNLENLEKMLSRYPSDYGVFLGHALHNFEILHPDYSSGFAISKELLKMFHVEQEEGSFDGLMAQVIAHESYILALCFAKLGSHLEHEPSFCATQENEQTDCSVYPKHISRGNLAPDSQISLLRKTLFAVKTCPMYHIDRLSIVKSTWAKAAQNIIFVSEKEDPSNGTVVLPGGEVGHCKKTEAILTHFNRQAMQSGLRWLVITDDDTLLSVSKVLELMDFYDRNGTETEPIALGERYLHSHVHKKIDGFDFITGGGGMIFNLNAVQRIIRHCSCPDIKFEMDEPDDIYLGICLHKLKIPVTHSSRMHQQKPERYDSELLKRQDPVSFHKFIETDPLKNYDRWFRQADEDLLDTVNKFKCKEEL